MKLNKPNEAEVLDAPIKLSLEKYPIAYKAKMSELKKEGLSTVEAEQFLKDAEFVLEIYYHPDWGLFAVEVEAVESGNICSPYNGEVLEWYDDETS